MDLSTNNPISYSDKKEAEQCFGIIDIEIEEIEYPKLDEALYKKLEKEFGDKPKRELRKKLQQIGEEYYKDNIVNAMLYTEEKYDLAEEMALFAIDETKETDHNNYLRKMMQGNSKILEEVYKKYAKRIAFFLSGHGASRQDAQDVFQDAMLIIFEKSRDENFELTCSFYTYLRAVCYNIWRSRKRKAGNKNLSLDALEFVQPESLQDIYKMIQKQEESNLFWGSYKKLQEKDQTILRLSFDGKSSLEIKQAMRYESLNYTRKRVCLAKRNLIRLIKSDPRFDEMNTRK